LNKSLITLFSPTLFSEMKKAAERARLEDAKAVFDELTVGNCLTKKFLLFFISRVDVFSPARVFRRRGMRRNSDSHPGHGLAWFSFNHLVSPLPIPVMHRLATQLAGFLIYYGKTQETVSRRCPGRADSRL
jgi:hypothetical protein